MREVTVSDIAVRGAGDLAEAFDAVFGQEMLTHLYGPEVRVGPWDERGPRGRRRVIHGTVDVPGAPKEVMRILGGSKLRATTRQFVTATPPKTLDIDHRVRMHFLGAELIRVRPRFRLRQEAPGDVRLDASVRVAAMLPPGISHVVEAFMHTFAQHQLQETARMLDAR